MALPGDTSGEIPYEGIIVASPSASMHNHVFRSAPNFNKIVDGLIALMNDHSGDLGGITVIKEWWEDPAIVGDSGEFPAGYILPLYLNKDKTKLDDRYEESPYIGDPLSKGVYPFTVMAYYKYTDIRQPMREVRNWGWNFWDIIQYDKSSYLLPGGIQTMTPQVGWHIAGTQYIIQWWALQLKITAIV